MIKKKINNNYLCSMITDYTMVIHNKYKSDIKNKESI